MARGRKQRGRRGFNQSGQDVLTPDDLEGIERVGNLAWWAYQSIKVIGGLLLLFFAWLQVKDIPLGTLVQNTRPEFLIKATLILYYASWITGCTFDTRIQQKVYVADPKRGQITVDLLAAIGGFFVVAFALFWASSHQQYFAFVLLAFVAVNAVGWMLIVGRVKPIISASREVFLQRENFFRLEQLAVVREYMTGNWQVRKFIAMVIVILFASALSSFDSLRISLGTVIETFATSVPPNTMAGLLPDLCILFFVLMAEGWIWTKREKVRSILAAIDDLRQRYVLKPLSEEP